VQAYEWAEKHANHTFCFALDKRTWNFGPWFSDAEFLYCRVQGERLTHLVMVDGTYVAWQGRELVKASGPSAFLEWRQQDNLLHAEPSSFCVSPLFQELTGGASRPAEPSNMTSNFAEKP
jgi:hypothetical protein